MNGIEQPFTVDIMTVKMSTDRKSIDLVFL